MVAKADSSLTIEFYPERFDPETHPQIMKEKRFPYKITKDNFVILLSFEKIPVAKKFEIGKLVSHEEMEWKESHTGDPFYEWYVGTEVIGNRTGRWFMSVMAVDIPSVSHCSLDNYKSGQPEKCDEEISTRGNATESMRKKLERGYLKRTDVSSFKSDYSLRTYTSGCYFYSRSAKAWIADNTQVHNTTYSGTVCRTSHLTSFGSGFFIVPNKVDFKYIFAKASFKDNLTIYLTVIVTMILYLSLLTWSLHQDMKDKKKLITRALPDNNEDDYYLYEILTFTGNWAGSSCDSGVSFVLTGEYEQTPIRILDEGRKDTLRKGTVDSYLMKTPRPLGPLHLIRIWHNNLAYDDFASWFLSKMIIKDIQTGEKYEFICNEWLAVEHGDGEVERVFKCAGAGDRSNISYIFQNAAMKHLKENHLWYSIFMRAPRSRFTRAQRTSCAFTLLFMAMLVNAMWYERTPEKVTGDGLEFTFLRLSPTQLVIGFISCLITFPPSFILQFMFRKSAPRKLRKSRIDQANAVEHENDEETCKIITDNTLANQDNHNEALEHKSDTESSTDDSDTDDSCSSSESNSESSSSDEEDDSETQSGSESSSYEIVKNDSLKGSIKGSTVSVKSTKSESSDESGEENENAESRATSGASRIMKSSTLSIKSNISASSITSQDSEDSDDAIEKAQVDEDEESRVTPKTSTDSGSSSESSDTDSDSTSESTESSESSDGKSIQMFDETCEKGTTKIVMEKEKGKKKKKKRRVKRRFTLPFIFNYIAWISCLGVMFVSVFYLWAYGVMFGNDKTYQWLTSLLAYFWSDLLIVEPLKVFQVSYLFLLLNLLPTLHLLNDS